MAEDLATAAGLKLWTPSTLSRRKVAGCLGGGSRDPPHPALFAQRDLPKEKVGVPQVSGGPAQVGPGAEL